MCPSPVARRSRAVAVVGLTALACSLLAVTPAAAGSSGCDNRNNNSVDKLLECVTVDGVREHQQALQDIAEENGGNRASGSPGYDASAAYIAEQARAAGLTVTTQDFEFPFFTVEDEALSSGGTEYVAGTDFATMTFSGSGDVTGTAVVNEVRLSTNVFAETDGRGDGVLMVGAHLDSVPAGPGINDNGSGSAAILEVAQLSRRSSPSRPSGSPGGVRRSWACSAPSTTSPTSRRRSWSGSART